MFCSLSHGYDKEDSSHPESIKSGHGPGSRFENYSKKNSFKQSQDGNNYAEKTASEILTTFAFDVNHFFDQFHIFYSNMIV